MGKRDRDREQHIALARTRARKEGANVPASLVNAASDYDKAAKRQKQRDRRTKRLDDLLEEPSIPSFLDQLEIIDQVESLLSKLSERDRAALTLHHLLEGYKQQEIAEAMGVIPARIHQRIVKGISRMKETLQRPGRSGKIAGSIK